MSYRITVSGHLDEATAGEQEAYEREAVEKATAFIAELEGVKAATFEGGIVGRVELTEAV